MTAGKLQAFEFEPADEGEVQVKITDVNGEVFLVVASRDQLDMISEQIDEFLTMSQVEEILHSTG